MELAFYKCELSGEKYLVPAERVKMIWKRGERYRVRDVDDDVYMLVTDDYDHVDWKKAIIVVDKEA